MANLTPEVRKKTMFFAGESGESDYLKISPHENHTTPKGVDPITWPLGKVTSTLMFPQVLSKKSKSHLGGCHHGHGWKVRELNG